MSRPKSPSDHRTNHDLRAVITTASIIVTPTSKLRAATKRRIKRLAVIERQTPRLPIFTNRLIRRMPPCAMLKHDPACKPSPTDVLTQELATLTVDVATVVAVYAFTVTFVTSGMSRSDDMPPISPRSSGTSESPC